jgi:O-antigen/teichoic acid export membrane protein
MMSLLNRLSQNYNNIHLQSLLGNGVMALFGMGTIIILYRALSLKDLGVYVFFMTLLGLIDALRAGFLTTSFIKFSSGTSKARARQVAGSAWGLAIIITGCCVLVNSIGLLFSSYINNQGLFFFIKYFTFITLASLPWFMANLVVQGEKRFDRLLWMRLINQVVFTGAVLILIILKKSTLDLIFLSYILSNLVGSLATLLLGWTRIASIKYYNKATVTEIFHFGKYSMGTSLSANLFHVTDTFFINFFLGPAALAVYNLAGKLLQIVEIPLLSFAASSMPELSGHYNNNRRGDMVALMMRLVGMLSILIFIVAVVSNVFAEPMIRLLGGEKYLSTEAPNLFRILMTVAVLYPAERFFALTLDVIHKPKVNFYKILVMLAVNLIGDYIGVAVFKSIYFIALVNFLPMLVSIAITYYSLNRYIKFGFWHAYVIGYLEIVNFIKVKVLKQGATMLK